MSDTGCRIDSWLDTQPCCLKQQNTQRRVGVASNKNESYPYQIMKRHNNLYQKITSLDNIKLAYKKARRGKGWQDTVKEFEKDLENNLLKIQESLVDQTYKVSPYRTKIITEPKKRKIFILPFAPDRIVQHAVVNILEPIWDKLFIYHSYACRKNKGMHRASKRTMQAVRSKKYCLKMDISKFYPSINHKILFKIIKRKIKCSQTLDLLKRIIFCIKGSKNVPIGNLTSQWFGNLYLNELDQLVKHKFKIEFYVRYCDDFCLYHNSKSKLHDLLEKIRLFLKEKLKLKLSKFDIFPVKRGVDFVGYRHFPNYILLRKSTAKRVKKRLRRLPDLLRKGKITDKQYESSIASTKGWLKWANTHNLQKTLNLL